MRLAIEFGAVLLILGSCVVAAVLVTAWVIMLSALSQQEREISAEEDGE